MASGKEVQQQADETKRPGFSGAEYNAVAKAAKLVSIRLISSDFTNEAEFLNDVNECTFSHGRKILACQVHEDDDEGNSDNAVSAIIRYQVFAKHKRRTLMKCHAKFFVLYETGAGLTNEAKIGFCRNVSPFAAYPYFRALVSQLTWNAGVQIPPLPAIASTAHIPKKEQPKGSEG